MHLQLPFRQSLLSVGFLALLGFAPALTADAQDATPTTARPSAGFELHIDARAHFPGDPTAIAHHYCKAVAGGMFECLLFASDDPDAPLVGIEVVVDASTYEAFDEAEQELWHYHKEEIPKVEATLPDLSPEEAAQIVAQIEETYGKLYILWDPTQSEFPTGEPSLTILH
jgi:Protein of unknown function (DUF1264)